MQLELFDLDGFVGTYLEKIKKYPVIVQNGFEVELVANDTYLIKNGKDIATFSIKDAEAGNGKGDWMVKWHSEHRQTCWGYVAGYVHLWLAREVGYWMERA